MKNKSIFIMFILIALYGLFANFAHPITPTLIKDLGLNDYMFGVAFAAMSTTNFLFSPFWGKVSSKIGCVKVSAICYIGYGIGQAFFAMSSTELQIVLARLFSGTFAGGIMVCQILYIVQHSKSEDRGVNLAIAATLSAVFSPFGYLIGGFMGDYSIPLVFAMQVIGLMAIGVLYPFVLKDIKLEPITESPKEFIKSVNPFKVLLDATKIMTPIILVFLLVTFFGSFAITSHDQVFNFFVKDQLNFPPSYNGILKAAVGFMALLANSTICLWIMKRCNLQKSLIVLLLVIASFFIGVLVFDNAILFIINNMLAYGIIAVYQPVLQADLTQIASKDNSVLIGVYNSIKSLGMVAGSLFAGFIYGYNPKLSFLYCLIASLIAAIFAYKNFKQIKSCTDVEYE